LAPERETSSESPRDHSAVDHDTTCREARNLRAVTSGKFDEFWTVKERQQFYLWFYERVAIENTCQIRWPLAAAIVAHQVHLCGNVEGVAAFGYSSAKLQAFLRRANQCIFDDALPKLQALWSMDRCAPYSSLTSQSAIDWDVRVLAEEQSLIQPLYEELSDEDVKRLRILASQTGLAMLIGTRIYDNTARQVLTGPGRVAKKIKPFDGNLLSPSERWQYGMTLAANSSNLVVRGRIPAEMPSPRREYSDGSALRVVDTRPRLHMFEALTEAYSRTSSGSEIAELMRRFSASEQRTFLNHDRFRLMAQRACIPWTELRNGMVAFDVDLAAQLELLDIFPGQNWRFGTSYSDIRPMIARASPAQKELIRSDRWRRVFGAICNNSTIVMAIDDLGIENSQRDAWIDAAR
jgi:hypothetical protein